MKTLFPSNLLTLLVSLLICGNLFAQDTPKIKKASLQGGPQSVTNQAVTNPDVLVITGKILDASTGKPVANTKINFDKFGEELLQASIDDEGNYALALNKKELGEPIRVIFKIAGYKRYTIKNINKQTTYLDANIFLEPVESTEKSNATVKYTLRDDPFNTMVIQMQ